VKHLWEYHHPYYCNPATWHDRGYHAEYESWAEFTEGDGWIAFGGDRDQNFLIRWDWKSPSRHPNPEYREADAPDVLELFFVAQRKGFLFSNFVTVTDEDEPAVRAFLTECAATMRQTWEPFMYDLEGQ